MRTIDEIKKALKRTPRQDMGPLLAELYAAMMVKSMSKQQPSTQPLAEIVTMLPPPDKPIMLGTMPPQIGLMNRIINFMAS